LQDLKTKGRLQDTTDINLRAEKPIIENFARLNKMQKSPWGHHSADNQRITICWFF
ncbi:hypothetical protein BGZ58_004743, partial [Dissophora ornata]